MHRFSDGFTYAYGTGGVYTAHCRCIFRGCSECGTTEKGKDSASCIAEDTMSRSSKKPEAVAVGAAAIGWPWVSSGVELSCS